MHKETTFEAGANVLDLREVAVPCLRHRLILNFEGEAEGIDTADIVRGLARDLSEQGG